MGQHGLQTTNINRHVHLLTCNVWQMHRRSSFCSANGNEQSMSMEGNCMDLQSIYAVPSSSLLLSSLPTQSDSMRSYIPICCFLILMFSTQNCSLNICCTGVSRQAINRYGFPAFWCGTSHDSKILCDGCNMKTTSKPPKISRSLLEPLLSIPKDSNYKLPKDHVKYDSKIV